MAAARSIGGGLVVAVAAAGSLFFAFALAYGAWAYVRRFGVEAPGSGGAVIAPAAANLFLFTAFALHHSLFARTRLRERVARAVSPRLERSLYVWIASALFVLVMAAWQPVGGTLWRLDGAAAGLTATLQLAGLAVTLYAASSLDVLTLSGLRQAMGVANVGAPRLMETGLYRMVRHPLYFGWFLMVWATPAMTGTRLVFAAVSTVYLVVAIPLEERTLRREFGTSYDDYARRVRWRMIRGLY